MRGKLWTFLALAVPLSLGAFAGGAGPQTQSQPAAAAAGDQAAALPVLSPALAPMDANSRITPVVRAYQKARPAVVNISAEKIVAARMGLFGNDPFDDIFPSPLVRRVPVQSLGSGFIVHPSGYIVTNAHVVRRAQSVTVTLSDNSRLAARIISADPATDLAVLKIETADGKDLPYLPLGRSDDLMVGETVVAIGNPLGYANSVTTGVVSAVDRTLEFGGDVRYGGLIQTDAPINPGNSGGPLLNINGDLIGINTAIRADAQNIGFAIPTDALVQSLVNLLDFERINRVVFGAQINATGAGGGEIYVGAVRPGTPADGKLRPADRLLALNGKQLREIPDYACAMLAAKPDEKLRFSILRDGRPQDVELAMAAKPRPDGKALAEGLLGMTLRPITADLARDNHLPVDKGLVVTAVDPNGPAAQVGVRPRDVLFQVDQLYVTDLDDLGMLLEEAKPGQAVRIGVLRGNVAAWVSLRARQAPERSPATAPKGKEII